MKNFNTIVKLLMLFIVFVLNAIEVNAQFPSLDLRKVNINQSHKPVIQIGADFFTINTPEVEIDTNAVFQIKSDEKGVLLPQLT